MPRRELRRARDRGGGSGRGRQGGGELLGAGSGGRRSEVTEVDGDDLAVAVFRPARWLGRRRLAGGLGGLVGDLALADPVLGLAVGEDHRRG